MVVNRISRIPALLGTGYYKQPQVYQAPAKKVPPTKVAALLKKGPYSYSKNTK
jgi:hypothetical protein